MVDKKLNVNQRCVLVAEEAHSCISKYAASRLREVVLLLYSEMVRHIWGTVNSAGLPRTRVECTRWSQSSGDREGH